MENPPIAAYREYLGIAEEAARRGGEILMRIGTPATVHSKSPRDLVTEADRESQEAISGFLRERLPDHGFVGEEDPPVSPDDRLHPTDRHDVSGAVLLGKPMDHSAHRFVWVVDPLDGTTNYVHSIPFYCVSVGLLDHGQPVVGAIFDPTRGEMFSGAVGHGAQRNGEPLGPRRCENLMEALVATSFGAEVDLESDEVRLFLQVLPHARAIRRMGSTALNLAYVASGRLDACWSATSNAWDVTAGLAILTAAGGVASCVTGNPCRPLADGSALAAATPGLHAELLRLWRRPTR